MKFEVDKDMVEPIIRDQIAAAVVAQMGDASDIITQAVKVALETKVAGNGVVSQYRSDNKYSFLEQLCHREIQEAAKAAVQAVVAEERPRIEKAVKEHLKRSPSKTASAIVDGFVRGVNANWSLTCNFEFRDPRA